MKGTVFPSRNTEIVNTSALWPLLLTKIHASSTPSFFGPQGAPKSFRVLPNGRSFESLVDARGCFHVSCDAGRFGNLETLHLLQAIDTLGPVNLLFLVEADLQGPGALNLPWNLPGTPWHALAALAVSGPPSATAYPCRYTGQQTTCLALLTCGLVPCAPDILKPISEVRR